MKRLIVLAVAAVVVVAGSVVGWKSFTGPDSDIVVVDESLPTADVPRSDVPVDLHDATYYSTPWDAEPKAADGVMIGLGQHDDDLRFTAVRADGAELWHADRPLACAGYTVAMAGDRGVAVLNDSEADDDGTLRTTATAYDLHTGESVWGPVEVPGPNYGPGLVYAGAPEEYFGDAGPLIALDARTGKTMFTESDSSRIIGEFDGVLVRTDTRMLVGQSGDGERLWAIDAADLPWPLESAVSVPGVDPDDRWAVIGPDQGAGVLIDTRTGRIHARRVTEAVGDQATEAVAYVADGQLAVTSPDEGTAWRRPTKGMALSAIGAAGVTVRGRTGLSVFAVQDGSPIRSGDAARLTPRVSAHGADAVATVLDDDERVLLAVSDD